MPFEEQCCRNPGSRIGHVFFLTAYALIFCCSLTAIIVFALKHNEIRDNLPEGTSGDCILYVNDDEADAKDIGGGSFCRFAIYGAGFVAFGTAIFLIAFTIKCIFGTKLLSCVLLIEMPLLFCIMAISLAHSLNTTIGLALTCRSFADADSSGSSCKDYEAPGGTKFFSQILISEAISWAATGALMILFVVYVIMAVVFWRKGTRNI